MKTLEQRSDEFNVASIDYESWFGVDWRLRIERMRQEGSKRTLYDVFAAWELSLGLAPWQLTAHEYRALIERRGFRWSDLHNALHCQEILCALQSRYPVRKEVLLSQPNLVADRQILASCGQTERHRLQSFDCRLLPEALQNSVREELDDLMSLATDITLLDVQRIMGSQAPLALKEVAHQFKSLGIQDTVVSISEIAGIPTIQFAAIDPEYHQSLRFDHLFAGYSIWLFPFFKDFAGNDRASPFSMAALERYFQDRSSMIRQRVNLTNHCVEVEELLDADLSDMSEPTQLYRWLNRLVKEAPFHALHLIQETFSYWNDLKRHHRLTERTLAAGNIRFSSGRLSHVVNLLLLLLNGDRLMAREREAARHCLQIMNQFKAEGRLLPGVQKHFKEMATLGRLLRLFEREPVLAYGLEITLDEVRSVERMHTQWLESQRGELIDETTCLPGL